MEMLLWLKVQYLHRREPGVMHPQLPDLLPGSGSLFWAVLMLVLPKPRIQCCGAEQGAAHTTDGSAHKDPLCLCFGDAAAP